MILDFNKISMHPHSRDFFKIGLFVFDIP